MKIKKRNITDILLTILWFSADKSGNETPGGGLLTEDTGLGLKRKLQKIRKDLLSEQDQLKKDKGEVSKSFTDKMFVANEGETLNEEQQALNAGLVSQMESEMNILLNEEIAINAEYASLSEIEKIQTKASYDFELIEMIAQ